MMPTLPPRGTLAGLLAAVVLGSAPAAAPAPDALTALAVTEVKPGVFVHTGRLEDWGPGNGGDVANLGFIVGRRCVAVIDTGGTPAVGRALRAAIERATPLPVCWVINTHAHPDHVLGNAAFVGAGSPAPGFVAHARFPRALTARETYYLNALERDFGIRLTHASVIYPDTVVETSLDLDLGERVLSLRAWPTAHTDNDLTVYDQRTRTLFASDLLFVQHLPVLDGSLRGWLAVMPELGRIPADTVVPGHGPVSSDGPAVMGAQASYLEALARDVRSALRDHRTIQQAVDSISVPAGSHWLLVERFHRRNVTAAYAELEWEDVAPPSPRK
ncbi:quinoprotein relay system zinc metallohydrolase 2 [Variovorax sp. GT1P44]|uniref:quinoprotein relay system zinc metallohydrolase 2 n=1 Tax=Variovorax sp. GT1P44 TaxID=3443742 RepID=UPI003F468C07